MTLGQRIQELRKQAGLSQEALGEALGVSRQAVSKWELDGGIPELDTLIAMSRLFGITVGQLLGVEHPEEREEAPETTSGFTEEQVEDILRRYVEESRPPQETAATWLTRWGWLPAAAIVVVVAMAVLFAQLSSLRTTVKLLRSEVSVLEVNVSNSMNGLSGQIRNEIREVLEEENNPVSSFEWKVIGCGLDSGEVTLSLNSTLKTYIRGETEVQYRVAWEMENETGQATGRWISGPDWADSITVPMCDRATVVICIKGEGGQIQEVEIADSIYYIAPENFMLDVENLKTPFAFTIYAKGFISETARAERAFVNIWSTYQDYVWPVEAQLSAWVNGAQVMSEPLKLENDEEPGLFKGSLENVYCEVTLKEGDTFEALLVVTDNLGRVQEFRQSGTVEDGKLDMPITAPAIQIN